MRSPPIARSYLFPVLLALLGCKSANTPEVTAPAPVLPAPAPPPPVAPPPLPDVGAPLDTISDGLHDAALIVAIEHYKFNLSPVTGALANATAWRSYLQNERGVPETRILLLPNEKATDDSILRNLDALAQKVDRRGRLWFIFIGHGAPGTPSSGGLLVGVDAQAEVTQLEDRSIPQNVLLSHISKTKGKPIVILDTCFSGRDRRGKWLVNGIQGIDVPPPPRKARKPTRAKPSALLLAASASSEYAGQLADHERPAFSYLLLGALRGWADDDHDGAVTAKEAIQYTRDVLDAVLAQTRSQKPMWEGDETTVLANASEPDPALVTLLTVPTPAPAPVHFVASPQPDPVDCTRPHFGTDWPPLELPTPPASLRHTDGGATGSDLAHAAAENAQRAGITAPSQAARAWCDLARLDKDNPHRRTAVDMCERWKTYNDGLSWFANDLRCLTNLRQSEAPLDARRIARHTHAFLLRYGNLTWLDKVSALRASAPNLNTAMRHAATRDRRRIYIDLHPISGPAYQDCINAGACSGPRPDPEQGCTNDLITTSETRPVRCITPIQAREYCSWVGKKLPPTDALSVFLRNNHVDSSSSFVAENRGHFAYTTRDRGAASLPSHTTWSFLRYVCAIDVPDTR